MYKVLLPGRMQDIIKRIKIVEHMKLLKNFHGLLTLHVMCQFVVFQAEDFEIKSFSIHPFHLNFRERKNTLFFLAF